MTEHETNEQEAREQLASRIDEMRGFLNLASLGVDIYDEGDVGEEQGTIQNYGLEWSKATTNHREGTVTYVHVLSTGGPHDEFQVTFDPDSGKVETAKFVYLPWFDRVEIENVDMGSDGSTLVDFYESFYGELVQMDSYEGRGDR